MTDFFGWSAEGLHDAKGPLLSVRTAYEVRLVQRILRTLGVSGRGRGIELGAGYGRITSVLADVCSDVIGFEREPRLVEQANQTHRDCRFIQVMNLGELPLADGAADVVLTFTVLQQMKSPAVANALREVSRVAAPDGVVVLVEDFGVVEEASFPDDRLFTIPRRPEDYARMLPGFSLDCVLDRMLERGSWAGDAVVGKAMGFRRT